MSHTRTTHSFHFLMTPNSPLPPTSLPFLQQEYLQAALQDNGAQLPAVESPVALTNVVSTEQGTLCSCIRVKYLLFISAKAREKKRKGGGGRRAAKGRSQNDQDWRRRGGSKLEAVETPRQSMTTKRWDSQQSCSIFLLRISYVNQWAAQCFTLHLHFP